MKNKYYNEAIIGNDKMLASFTSKGEMLRLFYGARDYRQFIDCMHQGVKVNDSAIIYLHEDINNQYEQYYQEDTNILNTKIKNTYFNVSILQTDFVSMSKDVLIKKIIFTNENTIDLNVNYLIYSKLLSNYNNMIGTKVENNIFMQYSHDYTYCMFSKTPILSYRLNNSKEEIKSGVIYDKDYIAMANDAAVSFNVGLLKPGEQKEFEIFIYINDNSKKYKFDEIIEDAQKIRKLDVTKEMKSVEKYWKNYVKEHDGLEVLTKKEKWQKLITGKEETNEYTSDEYLKMRKIYVRSILLFPLLTNKQTGGISAAVEVDENREKSGRYSYCWPRDAVFITKALDILNMYKESGKFYTIFSKNTQSENGMWEQRFYTDGRLAPCWGYQIDETASIVYGAYEHYKQTKDKEFLKQVYPMCKKAIEVLQNYPFGTIERFKTHESYDLWEMNEGIHLYSLSVIYAAFKAMMNIEKELNEKVNINYLEEYASKIKEYCISNLINKQTNTLKRSNKDDVCDISTLGSIVPFDMLDKDEKIVKNTIERIEMNLRTYTGGYLRFENDSYMGGNNPWPIATLWMALYNIETQNKQNAIKQIKFVTDSATNHGFLAEQVDNNTMQSNWVIGLGWSHAMYIIALNSIRDVS